MRPIRTLTLSIAAAFTRLNSRLSSHRALTRVGLVALSLVFVIALGQQASIQASPEQAPVPPVSLLPRNVGIAVATDASVTVEFDAAMEPSSVEAALEVVPGPDTRPTWNEDHTALILSPVGLWRPDESYLIVVPASATTAEGETLRAPTRYSFTTASAPTVTDFQVRLAAADLPPTDGEGEPTPGAEDLVFDADAVAARDVTEALRSAVRQPASHPPTRTATEVSTTSSVTISFSDEMDAADVEDHFAISPEVAGDLSWSGNDLVFTPTGRLEPGGRYTISLIGAHDRIGNALGGKGNFSFIVQAGAQLTTTNPKLGAIGIEPATVELWFSQPMDVDASNAAFRLTDTATGSLVGGILEWNEAATQLTYVPDAALAAGTTFEVAFGDGARDAYGNPVSMRWSFTTTAEPVAAPAPSLSSREAAPTPATPAPAPVVVPPPAPASSLAGYAVNQINASRAAYGFGPVVLDDAISAVAYAHAYDQAANNYFSHTGLNGSTRESRLRAGGISFGWSGENQCYLEGRSPEATLDWCHAQFMAEPYPGHWNHIANVLDPRARRVGVGIAQVGSKIVIVWDFTD